MTVTILTANISRTNYETKVLFHSLWTLGMCLTYYRALVVHRGNLVMSEGGAAPTQNLLQVMCDSLSA